MLLNSGILFIVYLSLYKTQGFYILTQVSLLFYLLLYPVSNEYECHEIPLESKNVLYSCLARGCPQSELFL